MVPYKNREGSHGFFGKVVRIDLEDFQTVKVLDLTQYDDRLVGFIGGASWANYGLLIPYRNDHADNNNGRSQHGLIVRFEMSAFDIDHIEFMNLPTIARKQVRHMMGARDRCMVALRSVHITSTDHRP